MAKKKPVRKYPKQNNKRQPALKSNFTFGKRKLPLLVVLFLVFGILGGGYFLIKSRAADDCSAAFGQGNFSRECWLQSAASGKPGDLLTCDKATGGAKGCDPRYYKVFVCADSKGKAHDMVVPFNFPEYTPYQGMTTDDLLLDYCKVDMATDSDAIWEASDFYYRFPDKNTSFNPERYKDYVIDYRFCDMFVAPTVIVSPSSEVMTSMNSRCLRQVNPICATISDQTRRPNFDCPYLYGGYGLQYEPGKYLKYDNFNPDRLIDVVDSRCAPQRDKNQVFESVPNITSEAELNSASEQEKHDYYCYTLHKLKLLGNPSAARGYFKWPSTMMQQPGNEWFNKTLRTSESPLPPNFQNYMVAKWMIGQGHGGNKWVLTKPSGKTIYYDALVGNEMYEKWIVDEVGQYKLDYRVRCEQYKKIATGGGVFDTKVLNPDTGQQGVEVGYSCRDGQTVINESYTYTVKPYTPDPMRTYVEQNLLDANGNLKKQKVPVKPLGN